MNQYQGAFVWWVYLSVVLLLDMSHNCKVTLRRKSKRKKKKKRTQDIKTNGRDTLFHTRNCSSREHLAFHHINSEMGRDGTCCRLHYKNRMGAVRRDIFSFQVVFCKLQRDFQNGTLTSWRGKAASYTPLAINELMPGQRKRVNKDIWGEPKGHFIHLLSK